MNDSNDSFSHDDISALARKYWEEEGQPEGKADEHWQRALETLRQNQPEGQPAPSQPPQ